MSDTPSNDAERPSPIETLQFRRFTAFESLDFHASPGINVLVGENETGKTHLMKVAYAACDASRAQYRADFIYKLYGVFLPSGGIGRLVKRRQGSSECSIRVQGPSGKT